MAINPHRRGGPDVPVVDGGTGAGDAATARSNLGAGDLTIAAHNSTDHTGFTGVGVLVQMGVDTNTANTALGTIPYDGTVPQDTEGTEILSVTLTPTSGSNTLLIEAVVNLGHDAGSGDQRIVALFKDSDSSATVATVHHDSGGECVPVILRYFDTSPTTSSQTWAIRAGSNNGNVSLNRSVGEANPFGAGNMMSSLMITEIA